MDQETKKKKTILYTVIQVVGLFVVCLVGGCFDFMNLGFTFENITTWNYWQGVIQQMVMYSIALGLGYLGKVEREELNNIEYHTNLEVYRELLKNKKDSFVTYVEEDLNPKIKKESAKIKFVKKLHKLDKFSKDEWKLSYRDALKYGDIENFNYPNKKTKKYCLKRFRLENIISDEYLEKNIRYMNIKYLRVNPNCFTENIRLSNDSNSKYKVENTTGKDIPIAMSKKVISVLLSAILIGTIVYDPSLNELLQQTYGWIALMIKYIIRLCMVIWSFAQGNWTGREMFYNNFIFVCNNRINILKGYITWAHDHSEETYADKIFQAYNDKKAQEERLKQQEDQLKTLINKAESLR